MRPVKQFVPLMPFAMFFVMASAALSVGQTSKASLGNADPGRRVVATGRLLGSRKVQRISVSRTNGIVGLVIESITSPRKILWETNSHKLETKIDSVRIADLDGDDFPEILTLWWKGPSAALRVFHWDIHQRSFAEISSDEEIDKVRSYRVERKDGRTSRLVVASGPGPTSGFAAREYELRNSRLVRTAGGLGVNTTGESGIEGQAVLSPSHPGPVRQGDSGTVPYKTTIVIWNASDGREVARIETGSDGRFRVALKPGIYRVGSPQQTGRFLPRANEETVTVTPGKFAKLTLDFDSGMR
jgi:hypothetical protein